MHEASIMESTLKLAEEHARRANATEIVCLRLRVGMLAGVVPEALEFAFDALKKDSLAEHGRLEIERVPAVFSCGGCGNELELKAMAFDCPECGGLLALRSGGNELELAQLEVNANV